MLRLLRALELTGFWCRGALNQTLHPQACKEKTDAFLFLFSFTDRASFEDLPGQLARVADEAPGVVRMVIGSKYPLGGPWDCQRPYLAKYRPCLHPAVGSSPIGFILKAAAGHPPAPGCGAPGQRDKPGLMGWLAEAPGQAP